MALEPGILLGMLAAVVSAAFGFLLTDRKRLLDEIKESNSSKETALQAAAKLGEKAPEMQAKALEAMLEIQKLNQRIAELERKQ